MMKYPGISFELPKLNELLEPQLTLGVPIIAGAIQINLSHEEGEKNKQPLQLDIVAGEQVTMRRPEGEPFQIEVVTQTPVATTRSQVLARPISELVLSSEEYPDRGRYGFWTATAQEGSRLRVYDQSGLTAFLSLIEGCAQRKEDKVIQARNEAAVLVS